MTRKYWEPRYFWFDTPDTQDVGKKMWFATKGGFYIGGATAFYYTYHLDYQKPNFPPLDRCIPYFFKIFTPLFGLTVITGGTLVTLAHLRQKCDRTNYVLSAIPTGIYLAMKFRDPLYSMWGTIALGTALWACKYSWDNDFVLAPHRFGLGIVELPQRQVNGPLGGSRGGTDYAHKSVPDFERKRI